MNIAFSVLGGKNMQVGFDLSIHRNSSGCKNEYKAIDLDLYKLRVLVIETF